MNWRAGGVLALVLLLAGCSAPPELPPQPAWTPPPPAPTYDVRFIVTQERADGAPLAAQVQLVPVLEAGGFGPLQVQRTDAAGATTFRFGWPTTVLVRVIAGDEWTQEGGRVFVDQAVAAQDLLVSDRDVFVPLLRSSLGFAMQQAWDTATAQIAPDGTVTPAGTTIPLEFPEGLQAAYLSRLQAAHVRATWTDSTTDRAPSVATGLAWSGAVWSEGEPAPVTQLGQREAVWDQDLPGDGWPMDLGTAQLQVALLTRSAIVGNVLFSIEATLQFGGRVPSDMPADDCHLLC